MAIRRPRSRLPPGGPPLSAAVALRAAANQRREADGGPTAHGAVYGGGLLRGTQAMQRENSSSFARSMGGGVRTSAVLTGGCWSAEEAAYLRLHLAMLGQERLAAEAHVEMAEVEVLRQIAGYICAQFVRTEANLLSALVKGSPGAILLEPGATVVMSKPLWLGPRSGVFEEADMVKFHHFPDATTVRLAVAPSSSGFRSTYGLDAERGPEFGRRGTPGNVLRRPQPRSQARQNMTVETAPNWLGGHNSQRWARLHWPQSPRAAVRASGKDVQLELDGVRVDVTKQGGYRSPAPVALSARCGATLSLTRSDIIGGRVLVKDTGCVATLSECDFSDSAWYEDDEWWCGLAVEGGARATLSEVTLGGSGSSRLRIRTDADSSTELDGCTVRMANGLEMRCLHCALLEERGRDGLLPRINDKLGRFVAAARRSS